MKHSIQRRTKVIIAAASLLVVAAVAALLFVLVLNKPHNNGAAPSDNNGQTNGKDNQKPSNETPLSNGQSPPANNDTPPPTPVPKTDAVCTGDVITGDNFTLALPAYVYMTALDAKNKTNPAATYAPGDYEIYKCYNDMANITQTTGVPGGWIDPKNPYQAPVAPVEPPYNPPSPPVNPLAIDVMSLDNTTVNWSHEYPSAFVKDYNGVWNISPSNLYLTFDCGYDYNNLAAVIMDTLKAKGVKAVFFVTGQFMNDRPDLVRRMVSEGHIVGNHSYAHLNQPENLANNTDTVIADIRAWETLYRSIVGTDASVKYFRPPGGAVSKRSVALMDQLGYKTLLWGAAYKDWDASAQPTADEAMSLLRKYTSPGDIILLHGVSQTSSDILGQYIDEYRVKGYAFSLP